MRRQTEPGAVSAEGSSRSTRLDPFTLPMRFCACDEAADGRVRVVELHREQVMLSRLVRGMRVAVRLPVAHYRGVTLRMQRLALDHDDSGSNRSNVMNVIDSDDFERDCCEKPVSTFSHPARGAHRLSVTLEHADAALSILLAEATDTTDIIAEWQSWARVLRLPLLIEDADGSLRTPYPSLGAVKIGDASQRRRRKTAMRKRRPRILMRRRLLTDPKATRIHADEREIIART